MRLRLLVPVSIASIGLLAASCGTEQSEPAETGVGAGEPASTPATSVTSTTTQALPNPAEPTTTMAAVTVPADAAAGAWSSTIDADAQQVINAFAEPGGPSVVFGDLFELPVEAPWPSDALLSYARHGIAAAYQGGFEVVWSAWVTTAGVPSDVEAAFVGAFVDERFAAPDRSENDFGPYVATSLTFPATAEAVADGWSAMTVTVLPEMDATMTATGRTDLRIDLTRTVDEVPRLSTFLGGWLAEVPVADGLSPVEVNIEAGAQPVPRIMYYARFEAPAADYERLVGFYAAERSGGALVYPATDVPADLAEVAWFTGDPSATLAGHPLTVNVERDVEESEGAAFVALGVTIGGR